MSGRVRCACPSSTPIHAALFVAVLLAPGVLSATCISVATLGGAYTQTFDSLSSAAGTTTNNLVIPGWFLAESGTSARVNQQYAVDDGTGPSGDTFSYGSAAAGDRALGVLRSSTLTASIGACFTNNTGGVITRLDIDYTGEQWRLGTLSRTDQLDFQYSTDATSLTTGTWTDVDALDFTSPKTGPSISALDGNQAANRAAISAAVAGLSIPAGATFWLRWSDFDASSADDGDAVDDFSLIASHVDPPVFTVNNVDWQSAGGDLSNGVCETAPGNGICTLRAAVVKANHFPGGGVTIHVPPGTYYLQPPATQGVESEHDGDLNLTAPMSIVGSGADVTVIDGFSADEVIHNQTTATLSGLSLVHGKGTINFVPSRAPAPIGGILNEGSLILTDCRIGDTVSLPATLLDGSAGAIYNAGVLTLIRTSVDHNLASWAGLVNWDGATATIIDSSISDNLGVLYGGIWNRGTLSLLFSTVAGNSCTNCNYCDDTAAGGVSSVHNYVDIKASIVYGNSSCGPDNDFSGFFRSSGYNVRGGGGTWVFADSDLVGIDPLLTSPGLHGGPTPTWPLLAGSQALDVIPLADCTDFLNNPIGVDQRGLVRPVGAACDIGAHEGSVPAGFFGRNLLRNGDAESSAAAGYLPLRAPVPNWVAVSDDLLPANMTYCPGPGGLIIQECPNNMLSYTDAGPSDRGSSFFAGWVDPDAGAVPDAYGRELVDLAPVAAEVAAGEVSVELSGFLGGHGSETDYATLTLDVLDGGGGTLQSVTIGPVTPSSRNNLNALLHRAAFLDLDTDASSLQVTLRLHADPGPTDHNYGSADNLALVLFHQRGVLFRDAFESGGSANWDARAGGP